MPKVIVLLFGLFVIIAFFLWSHLVISVKNSQRLNESEESIKNSEIEDPISENDENQDLKVDLELKKFYQAEDTLEERNNKKYEDLVNLLDNYIHRYVSLFLITSNLVEYPIKDLNELVTVDLEISISGEDLAYLQRFSKSGKDSTYIKNLSKLDAIFSKIARLKQKSQMEHAFGSVKSFFATLIFTAFNNPQFNHYLPFLIIFLVNCLIYKLGLYKFYVFAAVFINSLLIWDSYNLYRKRTKEVDIDIYVRGLQFKQIPADCDPSNMSWYRRLINFSFRSDCLQYFQNINKNSLEEVSMFKCIIDTYSFYLIQTPVKIFGASIRDFTGEISQLWPWPFNYFLSVPLAPLFTVVAVFVALILFGKRLRLSFFGASVELGDAKPAIASEKPPMISDSTTQGVREIRKLRPWTNIRFLKRHERDYSVRRRLLRAVRSFPMVTDGVSKNASDFNPKLNGEDFNVKLNENKGKDD